MCSASFALQNPIITPLVKETSPSLPVVCSAFLLCALRSSHSSLYVLRSRLSVLRNRHPPSLPCSASLLCALHPSHPSLCVLHSRHPPSLPCSASLLCALRPSHSSLCVLRSRHPPSLPPYYVLCVLRTSKLNNYSISERNFSIPPYYVLCVLHIPTSASFAVGSVSFAVGTLPPSLPYSASFASFPLRPSQ